MSAGRCMLFFLLVLSAAPAACAGDAGAAAAIGVSTSAKEMRLDADAGAMSWLKANYALKRPLTAEQSKALAAYPAEAVFIGAIFDDATPGALLMEFSPSKRTLARFTVLRWSKAGWKPLLRCSAKGPIDAKGAPITATEPVDVYEIYMRRRKPGLGFLATLGKSGDKLFGDTIALDYDRRSANYLWPDN